MGSATATTVRRRLSVLGRGAFVETAATVAGEFVRSASPEPDVPSFPEPEAVPVDVDRGERQVGGQLHDVAGVLPGEAPEDAYGFRRDGSLVWHRC